MENIDKTTMDTEEYKARIDLLYEFAQEASSVSSVSELLERMLRVAQRSLGASATSLLLVDEKKDELYFQVALGEAGDEVSQMRMVADSGIAGWVARYARPIYINDVTGDSRFDSDVDEFTGFKTESIIAVPMMRGEKVIGVLEALNKKDGGKFNERDMRILEGMASTEALILLASMAETAIENINSLALDEALQDGYRSTAEAWAAAADEKESHAYAHSQRVRDYAILAAGRLDLSPQEMQDIEFGALFHDIGKIGIDEKILSKPGPLTDREWQVMHGHSQKGAGIVGEIPFLEKAQEIVLHHHERYDGTGYPDGIKGDEIPIGARVVAVADAFDTMTTEHAYQPAKGVAEAISELVAGSGAQFCPVAVKAFVEAFREINEELAGQEITVPPVAEAAESDTEETGDSVKPRKENKKLVSDIFEGEVRLVVPLTAGVDAVRQFKKALQAVENVKIVLTGGSEEEGHIILLEVQQPMALAGIIGEMPVVDGVTRHSKDIIVELKNIDG